MITRESARLVDLQGQCRDGRVVLLPPQHAIAATARIEREAHGRRVVAQRVVKDLLKRRSVAVEIAVCH